MASKYTRHKRALILFKAAVAIITVAMLIRRISFTELQAAFLHARWGWMVPGVLLLSLNLFFQYRRWELLVHRVQPDVPRRTIFSSLLTGITLGFITPGRVGEFGRAFFISGADWARMLGLTLLDKLYAFLILYFLGLIGMIPVLQADVELLVWMPLMMVALFFFALLFMLMLHPPFVAAILKKFRHRWEHRGKIRQIVHSFEQVPPRLALAIALLALAQVCTYLTQFYLFVRAFAPLPLLKGTQALMATLWVKTMLPISIGDLGVRESAAIFFLGELDVPAAAAFDGSLLLFLVNVLLPAMAGLVLLLRKEAARRARSPKLRG